MPLHITTRRSWFIIEPTINHTQSKSRSFAEGFTDNYSYLPDMRQAIAALDEEFEYYDQEGYEIKAIVPLAGGKAHTYGQAQFETQVGFQGTWGWGYGWGLGYGYGVSPTMGFLVVAQRAQQVTEDEFNRRREQRRAKRARADEITLLEEQIADTERRLAEAIKSAEEIDTSPITWTHTLFGGERYIAGGQKFKDRDEAAAYLSSITAQKAASIADVPRLQEILKEAKAKLEELQTSS